MGKLGKRNITKDVSRIRTVLAVADLQRLGHPVAVASTQTMTIPEANQLVHFGALTVIGTLVIDGQLVIL